MGEFAAKFRPEVDLDEFERRLRAAAPAPQKRAEGADPLAELARLVGGDNMSRKEDPFEALFRAQNAIAEMQHAPEVGRARVEPAPAAQQPNFDHYALREPYFEDHPQEAAAPQQQQQAPAYHDAAYAADPLPYQESEPAWAPEAQASSSEQSWPAAFDHAGPAPAPAFRRKVMLGMGVVLALGVAAIGGTLAMRGKSSNADVVTVQADSEPAKVKPTQADNASTPAGQALFDRKSNGNVSKVVGGSEQPADLGATVKNARVVGGAAGVDTPNPPAPAGAAPAPNTSGDAIFPSPKKVKTVSVRADGSVIENAAAAPPAAARTLPTMAAGGPVTPAAAPKTPAPKSTERATSTTEAALKAPAKPAAEKPAPGKEAALKPVAAKEAAGAGGFAVQLAGTPSEAEARTAVNSYAAKYSAALQGRHPSFVQAKVGDRTVYRVRVGNLSEDGAKSMCSAIKAQGGNCFVAKN